MHFDPNNHVVKLCTQGMEVEGDREKAGQLFMQAWNESTNDEERFISAHYVARHQNTIKEKLEWDRTALNLALGINDKEIKASYPSLYLNVGKCYEDLGDLHNAKLNYELGNSFVHLLPNDGYGNLVRSGIRNGLERTSI